MAYWTRPQRCWNKSWTVPIASKVLLNGGTVGKNGYAVPSSETRDLTLSDEEREDGIIDERFGGFLSVCNDIPRP